METTQLKSTQEDALGFKQAVPAKKWRDKTGHQKWTYTWHVVVMLFTGGFIFPKALSS
jgi:hypothetical protein